MHSEFNTPITYSVADKLALFKPKIQWLRHIATGKITLISLRSGIFINLDYGKTAVLPYLISTICHEMIHCYDWLYGHLIRMTIDLVNLKCNEDEISYESHFTPTFKEKSKEMKMNNGITINITADNKSFE